MVYIILYFLVRHKVKDLIEFIHDDDRIRDERKKAKANRDKYIGMSNESSSYGYSKHFAFLLFISNFWINSDERWNDNDESISTKKKDLDDCWKSKTKDYSADIR